MNQANHVDPAPFIDVLLNGLGNLFDLPGQFHQGQQVVLDDHHIEGPVHVAVVRLRPI